MVLVLAPVIAAAALELTLRTRMPDLVSTEPARDVLFLDPDRTVGWKLPPSFTFLWTGRNPYCLEFRVNVATNSLGFRDGEWAVDEPAGTIRIAVLGDSFVEALQVARENTLTSRLERQLRARFPSQSFQTMNFGISNYSVGQYLMVYDAYVRPFRPDYVIALASYMNFNRTTQRELSSRLQSFYALHIRPAYVLSAGGNLEYVPANDFDRYVESVQALLETRYGDDRTTFIHPVRPALSLTHWALKSLSRSGRPDKRADRRETRDFPDVALNYRILEALHERVRADGSRLVFADAFEYLERYGVPRGSGGLVDANRAFLTSLGAGYVDVSPVLWAAPSNPQFECDLHFSPTGHRVLADALVEWFDREMQRSDGNGRTP